MVNASEFTLSFESFQCSFQRLRLPSSFLSHKDAGVLLPACPFLLLAQKKWAKEKGSTAWCFVETEPSHCLVRYDINNATLAAPSRNFKIEQADCDSAARKRCRAGRDFFGCPFLLIIFLNSCTRVVRKGFLMFSLLQFVFEYNPIPPEFNSMG